MKTVIYNPASDPDRPVSSVLPTEALSSAIMFNRPIDRNTQGRASKSSNTIQIPESSLIVFTPGLNREIKDEDWAYVTKHQKGERLVSHGALRVIEPKLEEGTEPTGLLIDFSPADAMDAVRNCYDKEWLNLNIPILTGNNAKTQLFKAVQNRIKTLENETKRA